MNNCAKTCVSYFVVFDPQHKVRWQKAGENVLNCSRNPTCSSHIFGLFERLHFYAEVYSQGLG